MTKGQNGKGSARRTESDKNFRDNYDDIFNKEHKMTTTFTGIKANSGEQSECIVCSCGWEGAISDLDSEEHLGEK